MAMVNRVDIWQINLGRRIAATEALCQDLEETKGTVIALIQEPYLRKGKLPYVRGYKVVQYDGPQPRAAILVPDKLHYFPIPALTDRDMASILIGKEANVLSSIYMDGLIAVDITKPLQMIADYSKHAKCSLLIGCDSNAHSPAWGDKSLDDRGEAVEQFLLNNHLKV